MSLVDAFHQPNTTKGTTGQKYRPSTIVMMEGPVDDELNPPIWPASVIVLHPDQDTPDEMQAKLSTVQDPWNGEHQTHTSDHHFSTRRHVVLVSPGVYHHVSFQVGYYTQVVGLGRLPTDVVFHSRGPYVRALNRHVHPPHGTCLDTFWRAAENFAVTEDMHWAVSQAAPLRKVHVGGDLHLHDAAAYASGGFFANSKVQGHLRAGGQQQYLIRNVELTEGATGGAWSMVYVGCTGQVPTAQTGNSSAPSITVLEEPWLRLEKPYLIQRENDDKTPAYALVVPHVRRQNGLTGVQWGHEASEERNFTRVRVVRPEEPVERIQEALDQGKDVVLTPGIIRLSKTLVLKHPNQVLLGLGLATLVNPLDGSPSIRVQPHTPGVRIAGIMLEASETTSSAMLEWGDENVPDKGDSSNPGGLFDVFVRVGGQLSHNRSATRVHTMMKFHSGNLVGDNLWLWRSDHSDLNADETANYPHISPLYWQSEEDEFIVDTGINVAGDNVTMYGLAVEHANGHRTKWSGNHGRVAFYQCELPYGVSQESFADPGYTGFSLGKDVTHHELLAPGIYSNFRNGPVHALSAICHPLSRTISIVNPFTVWLDNNFGIQSIVNGEGSKTKVRGKPARLSSSLHDTK